jgi:exodeoxyribonuclease-3
VNGIRAVQKKGFSEWMVENDSEVICIQETKAHKEQLKDDLLRIGDYHSYFSTPERKGYSGVAIYAKEEPLSIEESTGSESFDIEGRVLTAEYPEFFLMNVYFPNGKASKERLRYKMDFYDHFLRFANDKREKKGVIVCGDVNTAHKEIDIARPRENSKVSGFLPEEREWIDRFLATGFLDTFREFDKSPNRYSWWDLKTRARERNVGWRIDYFFISEELRPNLKGAAIHEEIQGSDHCPVSLEMDF